MKIKLFPQVVFLFCVQIAFAQPTPNQYSVLQLDSMLNACYNAGDYEGLIQFGKIGVEKAAKELGEQDTVYSEMLSYLGFGYLQMQEFDKVEIYLKKAIEIQKIKLPKSSKYTFSLNVLAWNYWSLGRMADAEDLYKKAMAVNKLAFGKKSAEYASSLNNLAGLYRDMSRAADAEPLFKEAMSIKKEISGAKHPDYARSVYNLGVLYTDMGQYAEAEPLLKESIAIRKEALGVKHAAYASGINALALLYSNMERYEEAEILYKEALLIRKEVLGVQHSEYAATLNNLAILYQNTKRYSEGTAIYKESLKIKKEVFGAKHSQYANGLNNLAYLYRETGNNAAAEPLFKEAIAIQKEILGIQSEEYIMGCNNLARTYYSMSNYANAWAYCQEAIVANSRLNISIKISKNWADSLAKVHYVSIPNMVKTLAIIYDIFNYDTIEKNKILIKENQIIIAETALKLLQRSRNSFLGESDKLRMLSETSDWVLNGLKVLDPKKQADEAFLFAEEGKSVLLMEAVHAAQAYSMGDLPDSLLFQEHQLQQKDSELEASLLGEHPENVLDSLNIELNKINLRIKEFKEKIEKSYPQYAALKYDQQDASAAEIQKLLSGKTALLEYVIGDSVIYIFYIDKQTVQLHKKFVSTKELTTNIKKLHLALSDYNFIVKKSGEAYQVYTETAHWFYQNLIAPALDKSKKISNLIIVTDGELGHLPFEAFLVEAAPQTQTNYAELHYLMKDYNISYNYSATLFAKSQQKTSTTHQNNHQIFAVAANYNVKSKSAEELRLPAYQRLRSLLQPLPEAQKEVQILSENFQGFFGFDSIASEKIFKEKAKNFGIIHLAMHGLLDKENPILSSLVFTEDGDSVENNFLQAYEISRLKLNADLVVLSACETGYGRFEHGNGIASLARAFMYAGASSLVVSLWQVNDHSTAEIMKGFYDNLTNGMPKDAALRQAKLDYLKNAQGLAAHPAFWSPFIQLGDSRPIQIKTQFIASKTVWGAVICGILLVGGIFAYRMKKE